MTWWQTLLVTVAPVLVTLVITNVAEERRSRLDASEREKDRKAEAATRLAEREYSLQDTFRSERRDLYEMFLNAAHHAMLELEMTIFAAVLDEVGDLEAENGGTGPSRRRPYDLEFVGIESATKHNLRTKLSQIELLGGDAVRQQAQDLVDFVEKSAEHVAKVQRERTALNFGSTHAFTRPIREYRSALAAAARVELGTDFAGQGR